MMHQQTKQLSGRNRRLLREREIIQCRLSGRKDIEYRVTQLNEQGMAIEYEFVYNIRSFAGVDELSQEPIYAQRFVMDMVIPEGYPCVDAPPQFNFVCYDKVTCQPIAHPWHPNIRYFGAFAGRVCLNNMDSFTELAWCVERVAKYLRYERYHALEQAPFPEDLTVARWVREWGEPNLVINDLEG